MPRQYGASRSRRTSQTSSQARSRKRDIGRYKSSLEKYCADKLSELGIAFSYEEMEFELQSGFNYSGTYYKMTPKGKELLNKSNMNVLPIRYTPDFIGKDNNWIIETKGFSPSQHTFPMRWKLFLKHLVDSGKPLPALFMPKNKMQVDECVEIIKNLIKNGQI
jgi:hypothetical protein